MARGAIGESAHYVFRGSLRAAATPRARFATIDADGEGLESIEP